MDILGYHIFINLLWSEQLFCSHFFRAITYITFFVVQQYTKEDYSPKKMENKKNKSKRNN